MRVPLELTFRNVEKTPAVEEYIRDQVNELDRASDALVSCRVAVEKPQEHQRSGSPYRVRIDLRLPPRHELVVRREAGEGAIHDDLRTVLAQAFDAARRKLLDQMARLRGEVKTSAAVEHTAFVSQLFPEEGYGFLETPEGYEYYFHRNSVLRDGFEALEAGTRVRFAAEQGEEGPQASTVEILGKPFPRAAPSEGSAEPSPGWGK